MRSLIDLRAHAGEIFFAGLSAVDPLAAVKNNVRRKRNRLDVGERSYDLRQFRRIFIIGCGKAAARMALGVEQLLGEKISGGIVVVKYGYGVRLNRLEVIEAGHPIPDDAGLNGARRIAALLQACGEGDLVFFLVSGGGSALLPYPANELSLAEKQTTTEALLKSGAPIFEINAVRKHLSRLKGGQLARLAAPATIISLVLSDVLGDSLEAIASGPTVPDSSTYNDCLDIIHRHQLGAVIPGSVLAHLERGTRGEIAETPKSFSAIFERVQNLIIGNNRMALSAAVRQAGELGYHTMIYTDSIHGESRMAAREFSMLVREIAISNKPISRPACVIAGGETTVTVRGQGLGGRNQEFALSAAIELEGIDAVVVLSGGTDGTDGPTEAAGGIVDGKTVSRALGAGLEPRKFLDRNDSYHLLHATGDLFVTGPTLTNVMDLQVALIS